MQRSYTFPRGAQFTLVNLLKLIYFTKDTEPSVLLTSPSPRRPARSRGAFRSLPCPPLSRDPTRPAAPGQAVPQRAPPARRGCPHQPAGSGGLSPAGRRCGAHRAPCGTKHPAALPPPPSSLAPPAGHRTALASHPADGRLAPPISSPRGSGSSFHQ